MERLSRGTLQAQLLTCLSLFLWQPGADWAPAGAARGSQRAARGPEASWRQGLNSTQVLRSDPGQLLLRSFPVQQVKRENTQSFEMSQKQCGRRDAGKQ